MKITFPEYTNQRYYPIHYEYVLNIFKYLDYYISYEKRDDFIVTVENKDFLFDFWDTNEIRDIGLPIFKFHTELNTLPTVIPFSPVSFYDWKQYQILESEIQYKHGFNVSNRQRAYGNAVERRSFVKTLLESKFEGILRVGVVSQEQFWKEINNLGVAVFVPGNRNNMLDRGQLQYFGLGCCTISPNLPEILPFNKKIEPNVHYLECFNDYSNLIDVIDFALRHKDICIEIGQNAKKLFQETCLPKKLGEWIEQQL